MNTASRLLYAIAFLCGPLLLASTPLGAAPACVDPGGMGGTGAVATGGIGGTGAPADEGGMGGTGIVGTITGFGSICVNGVEVHFDTTVPLSENGVPASSDKLAVGQVVAVEASASPQGLRARSIAILHAYEGPITDARAGAASLRVMAQPVHLAPGARVAAGLRIGEPVRVSGLRNARGEVVASRIDRAPNLAQVSAIGAVERAGDLQGLALSKPLAPSGEVLVRGSWDGKRLNVARTQHDPGIPFAGRVRNALVEGLVRGQQGNRIELGGFTAYVDRSTAYSGGQLGDLAVDRRIRVTGVFGKEREIRAARIEFAPERPATSIQQGAGEHGSATTETEQHESRGSDRDVKESFERSHDGETRERIERREESASGELERRERIEIRESADRLETRERIEIFENGVRVERIERIERIERDDKPERIERIERIDRDDKPERIERIERVDRPERVDRSGPG